MTNKKKDILALVFGILIMGVMVTVLNQFQGEMASAIRSDASGEVVGDPQIQAGKRAARVCQACHDMTSARRLNKVGPPLWGIVGAQAGRMEGYRYSPAHMERSKGCLIWDEPSLDAYLTNPKAFIPGNRMAFAGMGNDEERHALIAYLATLKDGQNPKLTATLDYLKKLGEKSELLPAPVPAPAEDAAVVNAWQVRLNNLDAETLDQGRSLAVHRCRQCHDMTIRQEQRTGPFLWGVVGRPAARTAQFCHSDVFLARSAQGLVWTPDHLDRFLTDPQTFAPGTHMKVAGIPHVDDRIALIGYLNTLK